jgi:ferritin
MAAEPFIDLLNAQIGHEFAAHQQYVAIAIYFDELTMPQTAQLFFDQAREERDHAMMMVRYLLDADASVARQHNDFASDQFMQWFIKEQVEEVSKMSDLLAVVRRSTHDLETIEDYVLREVKAEGADPTAPAIAGG